VFHSCEVSIAKNVKVDFREDEVDVWNLGANKLALTVSVYGDSDHDVFSCSSCCYGFVANRFEVILPVLSRGFFILKPKAVSVVKLCHVSFIFLVFWVQLFITVNVCPAFLFRKVVPEEGFSRRWTTCNQDNLASTLLFHIQEPTGQRDRSDEDKDEDDENKL